MPVVRADIVRYAAVGGFIEENALTVVRTVVSGYTVVVCSIDANSIVRAVVVRYALFV
jgi:hypothetical protein